MADRKVTYTLGTAVDPQAKKDAREMADLFREIERAAKAATKAMGEARSAAARNGTGGGFSSPASGGGGYRGSGPSTFAQGMAAGTRHLREEAKEREAGIRLRQRELQEEKRILNERVRANVEAGRKIREAARTTTAGHYQSRAAAAAAETAALARAAAEEKRILADRVRANIEASKATRAAARDTLAGNYRARAAGTYGAGYGSPSAPASPGSSIPADADFKRHVDGLGKAYAAQERAAAKAAAASEKANRELLSGLRQTAVGVGGVARAFVLLGVSGEENLTRALQVLAKFEAGMQGVSGVTNLLAGGAKVLGASRGGGGLRASVSALGMGSTFLAGAGAFGVGAGIGAGIGRAVIGGDSFGRMTDWAGLTDYAGERAAGTSMRRGRIAQRQMDARGRIGQRYEDFDTLAGFSLDEAGSRGIGFASEQARANVQAARARSAGLETRINNGQAGSFEQFSAERVAAQSGTVTALRAAVAIERERLSYVQQAVAAERDKTRAVMEGIQASRASIGLADTQTLRLAEQALKNRKAGVLSSPEQASALGSIFGEAGQEEAAKIGEQRMSQFPELKAFLDGLVAAEKARSQAVQVQISQQVSGQIRLTSDTAELEKQIKSTLEGFTAQLQAAVRKELEEQQRDRDAQAALQRGTRG
jgi:hypothetical protein